MAKDSQTKQVIFYDQPQAAALLQHLNLVNQDSRSRKTRSTFGPKSSLEKKNSKGGYASMINQEQTPGNMSLISASPMQK